MYSFPSMFKRYLALERPRKIYQILIEFNVKILTLKRGHIKSL